MNKIKTLTVNGESYQIWDQDAAHMDDCAVGPDAWSGKNTVDKLCPGFTESGAMVTCEPVEGYPLAVQTQEGAATITRAGKNLLPDSWRTDASGATILLDVPPGQYCIHGEFDTTSERYVYLEKSTDGGQTWTVTGVGDNGTGGYIFAGTTSRKVVFTVTDDPSEMRRIWTRIGDIPYILTLQLESGSVATAYEPYRGAEFSPGETIPALSGINTLWADSGEITVTGRADPTAVIEKLTNAIIALGGNI